MINSIYLDPQVASLFNKNDFNWDPFKTISIDVPESAHSE